MVAKYWFERFARLPVEVDIASEFRYREAPLRAGRAWRSSFRNRARPPTRWRRCAMRAAPAARSRHRQRADLDHRARERRGDADLGRPEIGVASTKAFTCQLAALAALPLRRPRPRRAGGRATRRSWCGADRSAATSRRGAGARAPDHGARARSRQRATCSISGAAPASRSRSKAR